MPMPEEIILNTALSQWTGRTVIYAGRTIGGWLTIRFADGKEVGTFAEQDGVAKHYPALDLDGLWEAACKLGSFTAECREIESQRQESIQRDRDEMEYRELLSEEKP